MYYIVLYNISAVNSINSYKFLLYREKNNIKLLFIKRRQLIMVDVVYIL